MIENEYVQNLKKARDILGSYDAVGEVCGGISGKAVMKWRDNGKPPRTEYTGETNYAGLIAAATKNEVLKDQLLPQLASDAA